MEKKQLTNKNDRCFKFTFIPAGCSPAFPFLVMILTTLLQVKLSSHGESVGYHTTLSLKYVYVSVQ